MTAPQASAPQPQDPEGPEDAEPRRGLPRSAVAAVLATGVGAAAVLLSASPTWITVSLHASTGHVELKGSSAASSTVPQALTALAGMIAIALVRTWLRRVLAVLIFAGGAGVMAAAVHVLTSSDAIARGNSRVSAAGKVAATHLSAAPYVALLGGLAIAAGGVLAALYGGRWPGPSHRYDAVGPRPTRPVDAWDALERGEDPTSG